MATKKSSKAKPLATLEMGDPMDYHLDELVRKSVLQHPQVVKRMAGVKERLRKAAQMGLPMDEDNRTKQTVKIGKPAKRATSKKKA